MAFLDQQFKERIDSKLKALQSLRLLPPAAVEKLRQQFAIEMTYNSNAIEGNRLTLKETFLVINEGLTIKGKPLKDHLEAKDHFEALNYLYESIEHSKKHTLSEVFIRSLQSLVVKETDAEYAGKYRSGNVFIGGSDHTPPEAALVPVLMRELMDWVRHKQKLVHPIELAALLHHKIVHIHPFYDGNGRTARLVMNVLLMQAGYPLAVILKNDRKKYYNSLDKADKGKPDSFVRFVAQAVERSMNIYLKTLLPVKAKREKYLPLLELAGQTPYSEKYLNLLARAGKIEAHKEKRNWLTTLEAIKRYQQNRKRQRKD
jgi:Fic family protein